MHKTNNLDDNYMGSGKRLRNAIKCYGIENFAKEILHVFDEEWKMKLAEKILVVIDPEISYNLCPGGKGGWGYVNKTRDHKAHNLKIARTRDYSKTDYTNMIIAAKCPKRNQKITETKRRRGTIIVPDNRGSKRSEATRKKMSLKASGKMSSQHGSFWITNGVDSKKIYNNSDIPIGWYKGRKMKKILTLIKTKYKQYAFYDSGDSCPPTSITFTAPSGEKTRHIVLLS